jgi:hypothetical protein
MHYQFGLQIPTDRLLIAIREIRCLLSNQSLRNQQSQTSFEDQCQLFFASELLHRIRFARFATLFKL